MISRLKKGNTFCVLPWIEYHTRTDGRQYFCCWATKPFDSEHDATAARQEILNNRPVDYCKNCYKLENDNLISPRQRESALWLKDISIRDKFTNDPVYEPVFFDIRLDNKCNLACISCGPEDSTLWQKELGIPIKRYSKLPDFDKMKKAKKIYMAGGEPFIIDGFLDIIDFVAEHHPDIELVINTNLTALPDSTIISLQKIKQVSITVSLDGYGKVNEYHRYPLKWKKFIRNLNTLYEIGVRIEFNSVLDAVSVFGLAELYKLEHFVSRWDLQILSKPASLLVENLPAGVRAVALENAHSLKKLKFYRIDQKYKNTVDFLIESLGKFGDPVLLSGYIQQLDLRRKIDHSQYIGVNLIEA